MDQERVITRQIQSQLQLVSSLHDSPKSHLFYFWTPSSSHGTRLCGDEFRDIFFADSLSCLKALHSLKFKNTIILQSLQSTTVFTPKRRRLYLAGYTVMLVSLAMKVKDFATNEALNSPMSLLSILYTDFQYYFSYYTYDLAVQLKRDYF